MTTRTLIAASASALVLGLSAASAVSAAPDYIRRVSPPSSNPHDGFRTVTKVPLTPDAKPRAAMARCDDTMMKDRAMRDRCPKTGGDRQAPPAKPD